MFHFTISKMKKVVYACLLFVGVICFVFYRIDKSSQADIERHISRTDSLKQEVSLLKQKQQQYLTAIKAERKRFHQEITHQRLRNIRAVGQIQREYDKIQDIDSLLMFLYCYADSVSTRLNEGASQRGYSPSF